MKSTQIEHVTQESEHAQQQDPTGAYTNADGDPDINIIKEEAPAYIEKPCMLFSAPEVL